MRHTITAREGDVDRRFGEFFPDLFLGGNFTVAHTTPFDPDAARSERQDSIFSGAVFDAVGGGAAIGLVLGLDYIRKAARYRKAQAQLLRAQAEMKAERAKLSLSLEQVWRNARTAQELQDVNYRAMRAAKSLLTSKAQLYEDGIEPIPFKDVLDASVTYLARKSEWLQSVYAFNTGVTQLSRVVGTDISQHQCPEAPKK